MAFLGKGQRVMGLMRPTLMPCFLAASIADLDTLVRGTFVDAIDKFSTETAGR